jgi:hypothetical protein
LLLVVIDQAYPAALPRGRAAVDRVVGACDVRGQVRNEEGREPANFISCGGGRPMSIYRRANILLVYLFDNESPLMTSDITSLLRPHGGHVGVAFF